MPLPKAAPIIEPTTESMIGGVLRMKLRNANAAAKITGTDELAGTSNYFIGNDPTKWRTNVPTYAKVKYEGIYSGIDLVYYGNQRQLEYDFIVAPGADPRRIAFDVSGAKRIRRDAHGDLVLKLGEGEIRWHKPVVYQEKEGERRLIGARYAITHTGRVGFELAKYDASRPLYIDPMIYSTYLGGSSSDEGFAIAVDGAGNAYITGYASSKDFPITPGAFQTVCESGCVSAFMAKINPGGSALVYSTYLGGSANDWGDAIAVDSAGNAYVTGITYSTDFPITPGAFQKICNGGSYCSPTGDAFVSKLNPSGSTLVYSTYLGGSAYDWGYGIAVDNAGNAYVTGQTSSADFPTKNPLQQHWAGDYDAFVTKFNPDGSALVYSTYLGGGGYDGGYGIALDNAGNAYVTGATGSTNFPTTPGAIQTSSHGYLDVFVSKINAAGSALDYSTYLGGSKYDSGHGIAVDSAGNAYVTGNTNSPNFPVMNPFQPNWGGGDNDAFVFKLNPSGSALVYSTYLGGGFTDFGYGIAVDSAGNAYVTGYTSSANFPITPGAFGKKYLGGRSDGFVSKFNPTGSALASSNFLGGSSEDRSYGIAVDSSGDAYLAGTTFSKNFPTKNPLQSANAGGGNAFVTKIDPRAVPIITLSSSMNPSAYGQAVTFTATITSSLGAPPDGETVSFVKGKRVLGTGTLSGGSASFTTSTLPVGTNYIKAAYGGDTNFLGGTSKALTQVVNKATTTTTLASSQNPSNVEQSVTFTATVKPQLSGTVTGSVTFYDGATALKTASLSGGVAKFTTSALTSGAHSITATYNGSSLFDGSSASLTQTVN